MDIEDDELIELWRAFEKNKLKYIMVGGFASILNGYNRLTSDIDVWIKDTKENRKALQVSLQEIGLESLPDLEHVDFVTDWSSISLPSGFELDIMTSLKGFEQEKFDDCLLNSNEAIIENVSVRFSHINQLIESKKAANRLKDQLDIEELEKIKLKNKS
jgi:predicted nucleotidyltransferase